MTKFTRLEEGFLRALVLCGIATWMVTEWCSVFSALKPLPVLACWLFLAPALVIAWRELKTSAPAGRGGDLSITKLIGVFLIAEGAVLLLIALVAPPNTWDSMTYHMSRVAHWASQGSLAHYPTFIARQLYISPWAEYAILQSYIVLGADYCANLVQWLAFVGGLCGVHLLTLRLGGGFRAAAFAALFTATAPMVILQATSTQTDLTSGFWCVTSVYYAFTWKENSEWRVALLAALAGALALFTKTTSFFFLAPFCALALLQLKSSRKDRFKVGAVYVGLFIFCASLLHGPHFYRNYRSFGSIAGPASEVAGMNNQIMNVRAVLANALRHYGLNLSTHVEPLNHATTAAIRGLSRIMGIDPDDDRNTSPRGYRYTVQRLSTHEDIAGNPLQALLLLILVPFIARRFRWYAVAGAASFLLLCVFLRLTPYNVRIHVPFFMLMAPAVALGAEQLLTPHRLKALALLFTLPAFYWMFFNFSRPLLRMNRDNPPSILTTQRIDQYFNNRGYLRDDFKKAISLADAAECRYIAMIQGNDSWEYALWALARLEGGTWRFEHLVDKSKPTEACAVFSDRQITTDVTVGDVRFKPKFVGQHAYLLLRDQ